MEYKDVLRAECDSIDSDRMRCQLRQSDTETETVFIDRWSFHDPGMISGGKREIDRDLTVAFPGDCEVRPLTGETVMTCER